MSLFSNSLDLFKVFYYIVNSLILRLIVGHLDYSFLILPSFIKKVKMYLSISIVKLLLGYIYKVKSLYNLSSLLRLLSTYKVGL